MTNLATTDNVPEVPKDLTDLYAVLGIERSATPGEIKAAYRTKAMLYHPDRNSTSPESTKIFQACKLAYEILMDPEKREHYDTTGKIKVDDQKLRDEAVNVLNNTLIQAIDAIAQSQDPGLEVWKISPIQSVRQKLSQDLSVGNQNLQALKRTIKRYEAMLKRFKSKKNPDFALSSVGIMMNAKLENMIDSIESVQNMLKIHEYALQLITDYEYDSSMPADVVAAQQANPMSMMQFFINTGNR